MKTLQQITETLTDRLLYDAGFPRRAEGPLDAEVWDAWIMEALKEAVAIEREACAKVVIARTRRESPYGPIAGALYEAAGNIRERT